MMSRMILACYVLALASGCCNQCRAVPRQVSLAKASVESYAPSGIVFGGEYGDCSDTIPHRPWNCEYEPWWDYHITRYAAQLSAYRAYRQYSSECDQALSHHFKCGFIKAFEDLALNTQPSPPIVPPPLYWNAFYRSCAGRPYVEEWFAGYDAGLKVGCDSGVSDFGEITLHRENGRNGTGGQGYGVQGYDQRNTVPQQPSAPAMRYAPQPVPQPVPQAAPQPAVVLPRQMPNPYNPEG